MRMEDIPPYRADEIPSLFVGGMPWCQMCGAGILAGKEEGRATQYRGPTAYAVEAWKLNHTLFHQESISREEARRMSDVRWCDNGNHPFKAGEEGSQSGTVNNIVKDERGNKKTVTENVDICSLHTMEAMARNAATVATKSIRSEAPWGTETPEGD